MKYFTKEVKIALVAIVGIIILFFGMNFLKGLSLFEDDDIYYITFDDLQGLGEATPIYADGYKVGTVKSIEYNYGQDGPTKVVAGIDKNMRIPKGSTAEIDKDVMGNIQVNLLLANNPKERVEPGQTISGGLTQGIMSKVTELMPAIEKMVPKIDSIMTNLNAILSDPAIKGSLANIQTTTKNLTVSTAELNRLMADLNHQVPGLLRQANGVLANTNTFTGKLAEVDVQGTMNQINATVANAKAFTEKLNSNEGTLGRLMNDPTLYNQLNSTVEHADSLVTDLKAHPKRYVHFSVFGKKDK